MSGISGVLLELPDYLQQLKSQKGLYHNLLLGTYGHNNKYEVVLLHWTDSVQLTLVECYENESWGHAVA
jgi:hypothetical protein